MVDPIRADEVWGRRSPSEIPPAAKRLARDATVSVIASRPFEKLVSVTSPDAAERRLKTLERLLPDYGLSIEALVPEGARVPHTLSVELMERTAWLLGTDAIAVRAVRAWSMGDHGLGDYLNATCATVRDFLDTIVGHVKLLHDGIEFSLEDEGEETRLVYRLAPDLVQHPWFAESTLAKVVVELRRALGDQQHALPIRMHMQHHAPSYEGEFASVVGLPVDFGHDVNGLTFLSRTLEAPLATADPVLHRILRQQARMMLESQPRRPSLLDRVRECLAKELPGGGADQVQVARRLGVSAATLRRRLEAEHATRFSEVADELRRDIAVKHLADPAVTIDEVSILSGFSQTTAFYRAFKRWFDCTPAAYRRAHVAIR